MAFSANPINGHARSSTRRPCSSNGRNQKPATLSPSACPTVASRCWWRLDQPDSRNVWRRPCHCLRTTFRSRRRDYRRAESSAHCRLLRRMCVWEIRHSSGRSWPGGSSGQVCIYGMGASVRSSLYCSKRLRVDPLSCKSAKRARAMAGSPGKHLERDLIHKEL